MDVDGTATLNGLIYAFGDDANYHSVHSLTYVYIPSIDSWIEKAPMPTPRVSFGVAVYQNKIYLMGGFRYSSGNRLDRAVNEVYDPATNTWTTKAPMPINATGINANVVNNKIYVISGYTPNQQGSIEDTLLNVTQIYDPATNNWTIAKTPIPIPVAYYVSGVIDGKIYVAGGSSEISDGTSYLQIYDPQTDQWTIGSPLPEPVATAGGTATLGVYSAKSLYVIGGWNAGPALAFNQIYDSQTQSWTLGTPFPTTHDFVTQGITATNLNDTLYLIGGIAHANEGFYELTEQYIPADYNGTVPSPNPTASSSPTLTPTIPIIAAIATAVFILAVVLVVLQKNQKQTSPVSSEAIK